MSQAELIADAESLSLRVVESTIRERAAYRATYLADPFARPEFERLERNARRDRDRDFERLLDLVADLVEAGLNRYARNLLGSTIQRCEVAVDLAAFDLLRCKDATHEARTLQAIAARQAPCQDPLHRLPSTHQAGGPHRAFGLHRPPAPPTTGGD